MEIKSIDLLSFGKYKQKSFEFPKGELLVFYGSNEAGKSTLFSAITTLLTGFSPATRESFPYVPWGEEEVSLKGKFYDGTQVIRRLRSRPDGQLVKEGRLLKLQNKSIIPMDTSLYQHLYTITAEDLLTLETSRLDEVLDYRLSGTEEGFKTPPEAMRTLDKSLLNLYSNRKNATKEINRLEERYEVLSEEVRLLEEKKRIDEEDEAFLQGLDEELAQKNVELLKQEKRRREEDKRDLLRSRCYDANRSSQLGESFYLRASKHLKEIDALKEEMQNRALQAENFNRLESLDGYYYKLIELEKEMDHLLEKIREKRHQKEKNKTFVKSPFHIFGFLSLLLFILYLFMEPFFLKAVLLGLSLALLISGVIIHAKERPSTHNLEKDEEAYGNLEERYQATLNNANHESLSSLEEERIYYRNILQSAEKDMQEIKENLFQKESLFTENRKILIHYHEDPREALYMLKQDLELLSEEDCLREPSYPNGESQELLASIEELKEQKHRALERREQFSSLRDLEDKKSRKIRLHKELQVKRATYQRLSLLKGYLEKNYDRFLKEEEPRLLKEASKYLEAFTLGRFKALRRDEKGSFMLLAEEGYYEPLEASHSKGTRNQLYLALRLAMAASLEDDKSYPMIFDEAFSNWDNQRLLETLKVLSGLSHKRQIFIMTCQEEVLRLFEEQIPCKIYRL